MLALRLKNGTLIEVWDHHVRTTLPSGAVVEAGPREDQLETARAMGYGDDLLALTRAHDPLHSMLADWLNVREGSFSLRAAVGELPSGMSHLAELEERAVIALQALLVALT